MKDEILEAPIFDENVINDLAGLEGSGGQSLFEELVQDYEHSSYKLIATLQEAWKVENNTQIEFAAHTLKSSSANLGLRRIQMLSSKIEILSKKATPEFVLIEQVVALHKQSIEILKKAAKGRVAA